MDLTNNLNKDRKQRRKPSIDISTMVYGKVPPQAKDLEEAVLGAIMLEKSAFDTVVEILKPECFYLEGHQRIYRAMQGLAQKSQPIDILTVVEELKTREELEIVGGPYYVTKLTNSVVSSANIETHSRIILQKFIQRELIRISGEIIGDAYEDSTDVFDLLDDAESKLFEITNSHLRKNFDSIDSVLVKTIQRIEDILLSNCFGKMVPHDKWVVDPGVFWRHSFGCALVCREFAERIGYIDPDKAYLAGLLHDLGIIVNSLAFTDQYREVLARAVEAGRPLDEQEEEMLGFTHCQSGVILAKAWALPQTVRDVIEWHHTTTLAPAGNPLIAITHLADLLCRMRNLGYGYEEWRVVDLATDPGWIDLAQHCPKLATIDLARFTMDLDAHVVKITKLVDTIFAVN